MGGRRMYMWRAVDSEGEVPDVLVQRRRNKAAALKLIRKLLKKHRFSPSVIVTDKLGSYGAALRTVGFSGRHEQGLRANNRAENSHQPVRQRERKTYGPPRRQVEYFVWLNNLRKRIRPFRKGGWPRWRSARPDPHNGAGVDAPFCAKGFQHTGRLSGHLPFTTRRHRKPARLWRRPILLQAAKGAAS